MSDIVLLKDGINKNAIKRIATALLSVYPDFASKAFQQACLNGLDSLELKERVHHIITILGKFLPDNFIETAPLLCAIKTHWNHQHPEDALQGFTAWPIIDYVSVYGINHPELALETLKHLTSLFSAEFAIQVFIMQHFDITYPYLEKWCTDNDEHVRRLVSEGTRSRLPWGLRQKQFCVDPSPILPLLERLNNDNSQYVRRSVANNLNDISKDHPQLVIAICQNWKQNASKETLWIIKHATRTLIKSGHQDVFRLLGYTAQPQLNLTSLQTNKEIQLGNHFHFSFKLCSNSKQTQTLVIDYAIHHAKANGKITIKVFKLKNITLLAGESITLSKKHPFKKINTRTYYTGKHSLEILINGKPYKKADFLLEV